MEYCMFIRNNITKVIYNVTFVIMLNYLYTVCFYGYFTGGTFLIRHYLDSWV